MDMEHVCSEDLEENKNYWLDDCLNESGVFLYQTDDVIFFKPNSDCSYLTDKNGLVGFKKPDEGVWYLKE